ncbi:hypothetical protein AJ88_33460 [Mesorhizobium amorphae CCBAU 01583]|nr:hypothetical protein AJ88_33460 [Mesorhizobium amorphae CCBAU 01583]
MPSAEKPKKKRASRSKKAAAEVAAETVAEAPAEDAAPAEAATPAPVPAAPAAEEEAPANARPTRRKPVAIDAPVVPVVSSNVPEEAKAEENRSAPAGGSGKAFSKLFSRLG